jgi:hypothetical protein
MARGTRTLGERALYRHSKLRPGRALAYSDAALEVRVVTWAWGIYTYMFNSISTQFSTQFRRQGTRIGRPSTEECIHITRSTIFLNIETVLEGRFSGCYRGNREISSIITKHEPATGPVAAGHHPGRRGGRDLACLYGTARVPRGGGSLLARICIRGLRGVPFFYGPSSGATRRPAASGIRRRGRAEHPAFSCGYKAL